MLDVKSFSATWITKHASILLSSCMCLSSPLRCFCFSTIFFLLSTFHSKLIETMEWKCILKISHTYRKFDAYFFVIVYFFPRVSCSLPSRINSWSLFWRRFSNRLNLPRNSTQKTFHSHRKNNSAHCSPRRVKNFRIH